MKRFLKPLDYFFVLRPTLFFPVWTVFLAGFFVQSKYGVSAPTGSVSTNGSVVGNDLDFVWVGLFLTCLMGASFVLNQIMDRHTDGQNRKLFLIADGHLTPRAAFIESIALSAVALVFGFIFSITIGVLFVAIFALTGWLYSFEPFKLKDRPILGLVANGLGAFLIFVGGWIVHGNLTVESITYSVPYVCAVAAVYLLTTLPDMEGDASTKKMTFGVKFGFTATIYAALFFELIAVISS
ncbi:MAG: UbiA prenyltransferase family protein, partial [bacterium]